MHGDLLMGIKKGFLFSVDALIASIIIISSMLIFSNMYIEESESTHISLLSNDMLGIMSEMKISEINNSYAAYLISQGEVSNLNNTIIEQIGELWALNKTELCRNLIRNITFDLFPPGFGYSVALGNEEIYSCGPAKKRELIASRKMISGYGKDKPIKGTSSRAYLKSIKEKKNYAYAYFGGFVGQGSLFRQLEYISADAVILSSFIEFDSGTAFDFFTLINFFKSFTPEQSNMSSIRWNISSCNGLFTAGIKNNISIEFTGTLSDSYIAGGYVIVKYATKEFQEEFANSTLKYYFPGIDGVSNLYSSFHVPGILSSMNVHLHFNSEYASYLTIGSRTVFQNNGSAAPEQIVNIDNTTLTSAPISLDYTKLSQKTVPIRFASYNISNETILVGNADIILITDFSGSMKKAVDDWTQGNLGSDCNNYVGDPHVRRTLAVKCLDKELVDIVMNYSGNRIWPIFLHDDEVKYLDDPEDSTAINNYIDTYVNGKGKTCIACAINQGYDILNTYSDASRKKFIILMTDGSPTHCGQGSCTSNSVIYGVKQCEGLCDFTGACDITNIPGQCTECINNPGATNNAYYSAQRAFDDLDTIIYTIGFGPVDDCTFANDTLYNISRIGNGSYQHSKNISKLREIYKNISHEILSNTNQVSQTVTVVGNYTNSILYPDSYVEMFFTPLVKEPEFGEITYTFETDKFSSCIDTVNIPSKVRILDAKVVSYSGPHWTMNVTVNGQEVFLLQNYSYNFFKLGDPFSIYIPPALLQPGNNDIGILTGDTPINKTGCSLNNSLIYSAAIKFGTAYSSVLPKAEGCIWTIETEDLDFISAAVPSSYSGTSYCNYTSSEISFGTEDSIDQAVQELLSNLDFDDNGKIDIDIDEFDLAIEALWVSQIPYLWGPSIVEVRVWQ